MSYALKKSRLRVQVFVYLVQQSSIFSLATFFFFWHAYYGRLAFPSTHSQIFRGRLARHYILQHTHTPHTPHAQGCSRQTAQPEDFCNYQCLLHMYAEYTEWALFYREGFETWKQETKQATLRRRAPVSVTIMVQGAAYELAFSPSGYIEKRACSACSRARTSVLLASVADGSAERPSMID